ncbi:hypothetical protein BJY21_000539 [Kineosphaera limosa]|nr:hypothetical protein [Kineosphaera limosa]NYD99354.1 hypothetical protein [Kineosphaera limosa]
MTTYRVRHPYVWIIGVSLLLTGAVWLTGLAIARDDLLPDAGPSWYYWQLPEPTLLTRLSAWGGYLAHQLAIWGIIYYAQTRVRTYSAGLHPINVIALATNFGFIVLHLAQSLVFYDGLAQDVSIYSSQGSVIALLVVVLLMENRRRGLFFGKKAPLSKRVVEVARRYHGYLFSWAIVYTFWYHPAENSSGHLIGFFYMFLLLAQGSLFLTRYHTNRAWTLTLEVMVLVHGALVALMQAGPTGFWPMFFFGFAGIFVITQMHGVGWSLRTRWLIGAGYVLGVVGVYFYRGYDRIDEIVRIPIIEYALVFVLVLLVWPVVLVVDAVVDAVRRRRGSGTDPQRSPQATGVGGGEAGGSKLD